MAFEGEGKFCAEVAPVSAADVDTVAGFVRGFYRECFDEEVSPQSAREQAERMIPRMLGYYADGRLAKPIVILTSATSTPIPATAAADICRR